MPSPPGEIVGGLKGKGFREKVKVSMNDVLFPRLLVLLARVVHGTFPHGHEMRQAMDAGSTVVGPSYRSDAAVSLVWAANCGFPSRWRIVTGIAGRVRTRCLHSIPMGH